VKLVLGRADETAANAKRCEFNARLRRHYAGQPVYDLAQVESTYPDGRQTSSLISDYASDHGHLNQSGRRIAARELIRALASTQKGQERFTVRRP